MYKYLFILVAIAPFALGITKYTTCKGNGGGSLPNWVKIEGCAEAPCDFVEGQYIEATSELKVPYATDTMTVSLAAYKFGIRIDFELDEAVQDACNHITGANCPLKGGETIQYTLKDVIDGIPSKKMSVDIEFALVDSKGKNMSCIRFAANVSNPDAKNATEQ